MGNLFIENVNKYIKSRKIKIDYLVKRTEWSRSKVYKILGEQQEIRSSEMDVISSALRKTVEYFLNPVFSPESEIKGAQLAFFAGEPEKAQKDTAHNLIEFIKYHNAIICFSNIIDENRV